MLELGLFFLFIYLFLAYAVRWFVISNSPEYFRQYGDRTLFESLKKTNQKVGGKVSSSVSKGTSASLTKFTDFFNNLFSAFYFFSLEYCSYFIAISLIIADYFYHFVISKKTLEYVSSADKKQPILLVHGYMMRGWTLIYIKKRLQIDGWENVYTWSYIPHFKNIPYYAEQLKNKADEIIKETDQRKIVLIGHSMGGLLARYYIEHLKGKSYVERLITLGTPHHGTQLWSFILSPCGKEMRPESDFLRKLKAIPDDIKTLSIYSSFDELVLPYQSSKLKGKNILNKEFEGLGHMRLIFSHKVYEEIRSFLLK